jgi:hypothetical protein
VASSRRIQQSYSALFGFNAFAYGVSVGDEWSHNMCPTISHSSVIAQKHIHVDHHFRRTVPLGFNWDQAQQTAPITLSPRTQRSRSAHQPRLSLNVVLPAARR